MVGFQAQVTYALKNQDGATITGGTGSLSYVAASNGNYLGVIDSAVLATSSLVPLVNGSTATIVLTIVSGGYTDERTLEFKVRKRGKS